MFRPLTVFVLLLSAGTALSSTSRSKRSLLQYADMLEHTTGRSAWAYNGYGCWCGSGGRGSPKDAIDRCCREHDRCWDRYSNNWRRCWWYSHPTLEKYGYIKWSDGTVSCKSSNSYCERYLCNCDVASATCFARNTYNNRYRNWSGSC